MNSRSRLFAGRRDVFWLLGVSILLLLPLYFINRAKTPPPKPVPPKLIPAVWTMELSPDGKYLAEIQSVKSKTKETIAEASREVTLNQVIVYRTSDNFPVLRHTVDTIIGHQFQWSRDSKKLALVGRLARMWVAPKFVAQKMPTARFIKLKNGQLYSVVRQTWLSFESDLEAQLTFDSKFEMYRLSTGKPVPLQFEAKKLMRSSGGNWTMELDPRKPGLSPRAVVVEQLPSLVYPRPGATKNKALSSTKVQTNAKAGSASTAIEKKKAEVNAVSTPRARLTPPVPIQGVTRRGVTPTKMETARVSLIDLGNGKTLWTRVVPRWVFVPKPFFAPDGKTLAICGVGRPSNAAQPKAPRNTGIDLLDPQTGKIRHQITLQRFFGIPSFGLDGVKFIGPSTLVALDNKAAAQSLRFFDTKTGKETDYWPKVGDMFSSDATGSRWVFRNFGLSLSKVMSKTEAESLAKMPQPTPTASF